jgi:hypothetical protein
MKVWARLGDISSLSITRKPREETLAACTLTSTKA